PSPRPETYSNLAEQQPRTIRSPTWPHSKNLKVMRYIFSSLYHVRGLSLSSPDTDEEIFADPPRKIRAILTSKPAPFCAWLDKACAIADMVLTGSLNGPETVPELLARQVERLHEDRANQFGAGVFLFFE